VTTTKTAIETVTEEQLLEQHGRILPFRREGHELYFRAATQAEYERFLSVAAGREHRDAPVAMRELALSCAVHPSRDAVAAVFREWPGWAAEIAGMLAEMTARRIESELKKA